MISRSSWRSSDSDRVDELGTAGARARLLLATDDHSIAALHLAAGGEMAAVTEPFGELLIVVEGHGVVTVGDEEEPVRAGDIVRWPPGVPHSLRSDRGLAAFVLVHPEGPTSWRVVRTDDGGRREVVGVFDDTERARSERERLRETLEPGEDIVLE